MNYFNSSYGEWREDKDQLGADLPAEIGNDSLVEILPAGLPKELNQPDNAANTGLVIGGLGLLGFAWWNR